MKFDLYVVALIGRSSLPNREALTSMLLRYYPQDEVEKVVAQVYAISKEVADQQLQALAKGIAEADKLIASSRTPGLADALRQSVQERLKKPDI
jgi:hypothetical protein